MGSLGEGVAAAQVGGHEFDDGLVVFADVLLEFVEGAEQVLGGSVIGEQQPEQGFDLETWWLGAGARPLGEGCAPFRGDLVDVAAPVADRFRVRPCVAELDQLLGLRVEETRRLGPGVAETSLGLLSQLVPGPRLEMEQSEDCVGRGRHSGCHGT